MSFQTITFGTPGGIPPSEIRALPMGRALTPKWVDASCDVRYMRIPWTPRPAPADASFLRHVHKLQGGDDGIVPIVKRDGQLWANDFHSLMSVYDPHAGSLRSEVQPITVLQFDPFAAIHVASYLNCIAQKLRFEEEVATGTIRAFYFTDCLTWEASEETKEAVKMWWVGGDNSLGAKKVLIESIRHGFIAFKAGVLGGVYYEGPLRGGYGMVASYCCVSVFPLADYHAANVQCRLAGIRDPAHVDLDGQPIPSDGSALLMAVDCQSRDISYQDYDTGRVEKVATICTGLMKETLTANLTAPNATNDQATNRQPSAAALAARRLHQEMYYANLAAAGVEARARDLARKAQAKQSRADALHARDHPPKDVEPGPSHKPPKVKVPKLRTVEEELVHQRWISDREREERRAYAEAAKAADHAQAEADKAARAAKRMREAVVALSKKHAMRAHRVPEAPKVTELVEKALATVAIE